MPVVSFLFPIIYNIYFIFINSIYIYDSLPKQNGTKIDSQFSTALRCVTYYLLPHDMYVKKDMKDLSPSLLLIKSICLIS